MTEAQKQTLLAHPTLITGPGSGLTYGERTVLILLLGLDGDGSFTSEEVRRILRIGAARLQRMERSAVRKVERCIARG